MRFTHYHSNLLVPVMALVAVVPSVAALAQTPTYNVGRTPDAEEIRAWDISVNPDGKGLPPGSGTAKEGAEIYAKKCAACHGPTGVEGDHPSAGYMGRPVRLVGAKGTLQGLRGWSYATTIWDFIHRAMPPVPPMAGGSLSADESYAVTAFLLNRNGIIQETDLIDAKSLPKVQMPKRDDNVPRMLV